MKSLFKKVVQVNNHDVTGYGCYGGCFGACTGCTSCYAACASSCTTGCSGTCKCGVNPGICR